MRCLLQKFKKEIGLVSRVDKKKLPTGLIKTRVAISEIPQIVDYRRNLKMYNVPGEMRTKDRLVDASNVQLLTNKDQVSRIKIEFQDGKKVRVLKKTGKIVAKENTSEETKQIKENKTNDTISKTT